MKKKELLAMSPLRVTPAMRKAAREDKLVDDSYTWRDFNGVKHTNHNRHYEYNLFFRAAVQDGILKVSAFTKKRIDKGITEPQYDIYISKPEEKWLVYETDTGKWRNAKISMLDYDYGNKSVCYAGKNYQSKETRRLVNEYFGTGNRDVKEAVLDFQSGIRKCELNRKHRNELEEIDAVMNEVPGLPKDFDRWIVKHGFINHQYLFYHKSGKETTCYCTNCEKEVSAPKVLAHNQDIKCPDCKATVTCKSYSYAKGLPEYIGCAVDLIEQ